MSDPRLLKFSLWIVLLATLPCACRLATLACPCRVATPIEKQTFVRNVLVIMGDDHSAEVMGAYGNQVIRTPNLDGLAVRSLRFDSAYVNAPVCTPSRQSLITGKLPHAAGVTLLKTPLSPQQVTIAEHLKQAGFRTAAVGKMHFNSELKHGFDFRVDVNEYRRHLESNPAKPIPENIPVRPPWRPFRDPARVWLNAEMRPGGRYDSDSEGTFFATKAVQFLKRNQTNRFCLWVSFREPHSPFNFPVEFRGKYRPDRMDLPAVGPEDSRWIPAVFRDLTDQEKREIIASYYMSVEYLDKNIGLVLDALEALGLAENTLIIYAGDNGYLLGHHGRFEKHTMWEPAVRVPLLIHVPGFAPGSTEALVELVDLVPTIIDLLGVSPLPGLQGSTLTPLLAGKATTHRSSVFSEFLPDNMAMIRTKTWKYVFTSGKHDLAMGYATGEAASGVFHRLYNVAKDPDEFENLAGKQEFREVLKSLKEKMLQRFMRSHPYAAQLPPGLKIDEQLAWFCEPVENFLGEE